MKRIIIAFFILAAASTTALAQMGRGPMGWGWRTPPRQYQEMPDQEFEERVHISRGGQLYDNWWRTTVDTNKPEDNHPLWSEQSNNKRSGYDTYRCKECHGWDYLGKDGAYSKGSHYTGFIGIFEASGKMSLTELEASLKGSTNKKHDFSGLLSENDMADLALFMEKGLVDTKKFVKADGTPVGGDSYTGSYLFRRNCMHMCHGGWGTAINFGDADEPEFVGTIANNNPWEFIHKVRAGQPGSRMPSGIINEWSDKDIADLLSFSRTLPKDASDVGWGRGWGRGFMGYGMHDRMFAPGRGRGFGPTFE